MVKLLNIKLYDNEKITLYYKKKCQEK
jgi:hypothetical protein